MDEQIWLRRDEETAPAWEAAELYFAMGPDRSHSAVAAKIGKSERLVSGWSSKHNWMERAAAYDEHMSRLQQAAREQLVQSNAVEWASRYQATRSDIYDASTEAMRRIDGRLREDELSAKDTLSLVTAMEKVAKLRILATERPTSREGLMFTGSPEELSDEELLAILNQGMKGTE